MLELAAVMLTSAVVLTFFSDATSGTMKITRALRRRGHDKIRVAGHH